MYKILFEDNHILVVYKGIDYLVQKDISCEKNLLDDLKIYIKEKYKKTGNVYLALVHRLDKNTEGIMVFAKTSKAASRLSKDFKERLVKKEYLAICENHFSLKYEVLIDNLYKDEKLKKSFIDQKKGKMAKLEYNLLKNIVYDKKELGIIKVTLHSGRFHQIRAQLSNIGHPLLNDKKYGSICNGKYNSLYAYRLLFNHPVKKELMEFKYINRDSLINSLINENKILI